MHEPLQIGIIGDYNPASRYHQATQNALQHSAAGLQFPLEITWIPTPELGGDQAEQRLAAFAGLWCAPGSPYDSMQGALNGIRYARQKGKAFIGT